MKQQRMARGALATALALALSACGGGGGGSTVIDSPPPPTTPVPPVTPPVTPPPDPLAAWRAPEPVQPTFDAHLRITNATASQTHGFNGAGVRIGVLDTGVNRNHPTLSGRVPVNLSYVDPAINNLGVDDVQGHGTTVASLAAGVFSGAYVGGVAPGAQVVSARIINDTSPDDDGSGDGNEVDGALGLSGVHAALISQGVRVMNNSWGGLYWNDASVTSQIAGEYRPFILQNDGLVVFATGNEARTNPSDMAALPSQAGPGGTRPAADLERGWLAVTAVDSTQPDKLASYANACGVAANYCLAAPGTVAYLDPDATTSNGIRDYYWNSGTSYAAPLVSGAAALVWQRYPWFTNDLVRQTLLGTATDLGPAGVDPVFGYGLLNVGKAIDGPGRFDWGTVVADFSAGGPASVWSNDISGQGGLTKRGNGVLALAGNNSYTGATRVERGTLVLRDGATLRSNVTVLPTGTDGERRVLQFEAGNITVHGGVDNGSLLRMDADDTRVTVDGDFVQRAGGSIQTALGANPLLVTGKATIEGGTVHVSRVVTGFVPSNGTTQTLLRAQQGLTGTFDPLIGSESRAFSLLEATLGYDSTSAWMNIQRVNVTILANRYAMSGTALATAGRVESAFAYLDDEVQDPGVAGSGFALAAGELQRTQGGAALAASLESLSGRAHGQAMQMSLDMIDMNRRVLADKLQQLRSPEAMLAGWGTSLGEAGQGATGRGGQVARGWMSGRTLLQDGPLQLGYAVSHTEAGSDSDWGSDRARDRHGQLQMYAAWNGQQGYVLGQAALGHSSRRIDRQLLLGAAALGVQARQQSRFDSVALESGWRFGDDRAGLTPYVGVNSITLRNDAVEETGGAGFGLQLAASDIKRQQALLGLRGQRQWRGWGVQGYLEWQEQLGSQGAQWASFTALQDWAPLSQAGWARSSGLFGLSLSGRIGQDGQLSFGVDQRLGGDRARLLQLGYTHAF